MRLEIASSKAVSFAVKNYHYSKSVPLVQVAYCVFNSSNEFCGVICYSIGANKNIAKPYSLNQGQVIELVRVALNGKQEATSKAVSMSLKRLKKDCPAVRLVVSYADMAKNHIGTIYQATNWIFEGSMSSSGLEVYAKGRWMHKKSFDSLKVKPKIEATRKKAGKHKYLYPLDKKMRNAIQELSKPYPKKDLLTGEKQV